MHQVNTEIWTLNVVVCTVSTTFLGKQANSWNLYPPLAGKFEKKTVHICGSYCTETKCDRQIDRQTDGQTQINNPPFFFKKAGDNKKEGQKSWWRSSKDNDDICKIVHMLVQILLLLRYKQVSWNSTS